MHELSERIRRNMHSNVDDWIVRLMTEAANEIDRLCVVLDVHKRYINGDIAAQIDGAFEEKKRTGKFPFED